ncbi:MAG TPA: hypothetical protein VFS76_14060 [Pyrinomonadaceae bacterium]|nr:hypothetical protein [Pyrinomonadaceae bacterium]
MQLRVGDVNEIVSVTTRPALIELATISVGQVVDEQTIQELPLNGRHFIDLGLLVPGSVTPPQNGFLSAPARGQGSAALNTAGNREDTGNYQINGITLNDQINNTISFLPPISSIQEFKFDNSTFSAEYGRNSGSVVNIATRNGTNEFHGELFEFIRNDALDARNFFNFVSSEPSPFSRHQFGGAVGGPVSIPRFGEGGPVTRYNGRNRTFFFLSYEGLRQRQGLDLNSRVLSDQQRASITNPIVGRLVDLIPRPNFTDASGTPRFIGSTTASVTVDQWTADITHKLSKNSDLHFYYALQTDNRDEPTLQGNTIPGFGDKRPGTRQILTVNMPHIVSPTIVNELRLGFNRNTLIVAAGAPLNPSEFSIRNSVDKPIGLPLISVAGDLNFGGPALNNGRSDTSFAVSNTLNMLRGDQSIKIGGEYRRVFSNLFVNDPGRFNFPSVAAFIDGRANSFSITLGDQSASIAQGALDLFGQGSFRWRSNLTIEAGLRYSWNMTPTERFNRFVIFDPATVSLVRAGIAVDQVYKTNANNFQPRVGLAWDPFADGKTSVRAAYALLTEQALINAVQPLVSNPPFATPLTVTGTVQFDNAIDVAGAAGVAPISVEHDYDNSYIQSWNLHVQREVMPDLAVMAGYFGSKGTHLRISRNINQPANGVRPFTRLSSTSPILPGASLGNITQIEGAGNSSYNALWTNVTRRFKRGLQLNASYTWSKSIDYNSLSSPPAVITVQNSYDLRADRGLSDFDARHRFVLSTIYELPFDGTQLTEGWQLTCIVQSQSGNPLNIITTNTTVNGVPNTLRPEVVGPVASLERVDQWFDTSRFIPVARFGNLGRNVIVGPAFTNVDVSVLKDIKLDEARRVQIRFEVFDLLNTANFGQPGRVVGSAAFGQITNTRFPTGDSGSSRQLQFALKFLF